MKRNSWHSNLYKTLYNVSDGNLPDNLCDYFWKVMFALITLPFWCVLGKTNDPALFKIFFGFMFELLASMLAFVVSMNIITDLQITNYVLAFFMPVICVLGAFIALLISIGIIFLGDYIHSKHKSRTESKKSESLFTAKWKAFKGKYCPKIYWED